MTYEIEIQSSRYDVDRERLRRAIEAVLGYQGQASLVLTVKFVDTDEIQALNAGYRGVDAPTDVLSFPAEMPPMPDEADEPNYLGDIAVCFPYTQVQAQRFSHPLSELLDLMVVHGTLHLLGYDHDTAENRAKMWDVQAVILAKLGISDAIVPSLEEFDGE